MSPADVQEAGDFGVGLAALGDCLGADQEVTLPEGLLVGCTATESIGLMGDFGGKNP